MRRGIRLAKDLRTWRLRSNESTSALPCLAVDPVNFRLAVTPDFQLDPFSLLGASTTTSLGVLQGMPKDFFIKCFVGCLLIFTKATITSSFLAGCSINFCTQPLPSSAHQVVGVSQTTPLL